MNRLNGVCNDLTCERIAVHKDRDENLPLNLSLSLLNFYDYGWKKKRNGNYFDLGSEQCIFNVKSPKGM